MVASTTYRRLFVRWMAIEMRDRPQTLADLLDKLIVAKVKETGSGRMLIASAANGHTAQWQVPPDFTPMDAAEMVEDICRRKDEALTYLGGTPTDADLITEILRCLQDSDDGPIGNYRNLRNEGVCL